MFVSDSVVVRVSGATLPHSPEESSKPAASVAGGPFPNTPATRAVVAGIGCLLVALTAGLFFQFADMTEAQASPVRIAALQVVDQPLPTVPPGAISAARSQARH
jgi:hypothetical protein